MPALRSRSMKLRPEFADSWELMNDSRHGDVSQLIRIGEVSRNRLQWSRMVTDLAVPISPAQFAMQFRHPACWLPVLARMGVNWC
jgi:hypothetical protein